ncbi:MAG: two-component sensor histidine kinase [Labilithrix sp.]|nr:two-component sensor histidine kinase [Labilithrix sp.]
MARKSTLQGAAIVVADDHVDSADLLAMVLESAGADVRTGNTAAEVLDLATSFAADLVLLDITLPDMDGYELLAALRAIGAYAATPALAVTGHASERDRARSADAGFVVHVTKPFDNDALVLVLGELVASRREAPPPPPDPSTSETTRQRLVEKGIAINAGEIELLARLAPLLGDPRDPQPRERQSLTDGPHSPRAPRR